MENIPEIEELIKLISKLPGLEPKSARRIILKLINNKEDLHKPMVNSMANVFKNIIRCNKCGSIKSINASCQNCEKKNNKSNKICIVETISDQWSIENSNVFDGYFHILHAPNHRAIKGSDYVTSAVEDLIDEGYKIKLDLIEKASNDKILKSIAKSLVEPPALNI